MKRMRKFGGITIHEVGQPTFEGERSHGQRRPFFFLPKSQVLLLGAPGGDHWNMVAHDPVAKRFEREVFDDDETAYGGLYRTPSGENVVEFYRGTPDVEHIPAIIDALGANRAQLNEWHIGDEVHDNPDATWHWNFQSRDTKKSEKWQLKVAMPVSDDFWSKWPGSLYHGTTQDRLDSIMQHGLHPWDSEIAGGSNYEGGKFQWLQPRPDHVYLSQGPFGAHNKALAGAPRGSKVVVLKVDPRYLRPENINPDEDDMHYYVPGAPSPHQKSLEAPPELQDRSLGEYAEEKGWGHHPEQTERSIADENAIAHRGVIPPEAITPGYVTPGTRTWTPLAWPPRMSAAPTSPWEWGKWGKGIYYPETGVLQVWGDDRTHPDVWNDDENYSQPGSAHHIVIRPNGTVHDQGAFNRDFSDAESDVVGLQQAIKELDSRLRLDPPSDWSFGPTEPMEEEPSSISRGEEGGSIHDVQTANDFAGSL